MVSLQIVRQSNTHVTSLPKGLVALFIGATSGIGQATLEQFARLAPSPRIYTVARPPSVASHETLLATLRESNPAAAIDLITADVSLISEVDKVVAAITKKETRLDFLFLSAGLMAVDGRAETAEGLEITLATSYYSKLRAASQLLPLLNNSVLPSPRIVSVLAGGTEGPINEADLGLRDVANWSSWNAAVHSNTMGTLSLERIARENPRISIVHWFPGPVDTRLFRKLHRAGSATPPTLMKQEESGERVVFMATNDRYGVQGGLVTVPQGLGPAFKSGGGIFLVNPQGESTDNEAFLSGLRGRGVHEAVWKHTEEVFASTAAKVGSSKDEL